MHGNIYLQGVGDESRWLPQFTLNPED